MPRATNLREPASELIGREAEVRDVTDLVTKHRLVTLVGTGGIGKTRLGLEVARDLLARFPDGVFVAELGPLSSPESGPATVATALGLTLATSREPLRVDGEYAHRVPPLAVPAEDNQDMDDVLRYGAVKLFVSRASAAEAQCVSDVRLAAAIAAICRRLDGIELAAAGVAAFGIEGVAAGLDDRFRLLTGGNRTALRRHQTLVVQPQGEVSCGTRPRPRERSWGYWAEGG